MKELSLNILDIVENSTKAGSTLTIIEIIEKGEKLELIITDNGCGMSQEILEGVTNPFYTTRTTRKVGLGIPLLKQEAELTGGSFNITSKVKTEASTDHGTKVSASFFKSHIDFTPLGDVISTVVTLIQGHPDKDFLFIHKIDEKEIRLDTRELRRELEDIPLNSFEILNWIREYLKEQYIGK